MNKYHIGFIEDSPKYYQIAKHIIGLIDENQIEDGEKLPPIRKLAKELEVNNVTIVSAYKKLENEGYAVQKMGSGTYAKRKDLNVKFKKEYSNTFKRLTPNSLSQYIDFTGETTSSAYFPVDTFKNVLNTVLDRDGAAAFVYKEPLGYEGLRRSISSYFWNNNLDIEDILIVSGAQQGIDIVSKSIINVNDNVVVEKPTYSGALSVFKWRRANIFEVDMLEDGINILQLEEILKKNKIKCFYAMSYFQNPSGASYSIDKKKRILELAEEYDFYIIEDDYLSELIYDPSIEYTSFKRLDRNDRVIYIKSFSKIFLPGIRMGYLISPAAFKESMQRSKINTDISTSSLMQRALDLYINKGLWNEHISYLNSIYKEKYYLLEDCLKTELGKYVSFKAPGGGLNIYIKIKTKKVTSVQLFYHCRKEKVLITPGVLFYKNGEDGNEFFKMSFSQVDKDQIERGIKTIRNIFDKITQ